MTKLQFSKEELKPVKDILSIVNYKTNELAVASTHFTHQGLMLTIRAKAHGTINRSILLSRSEVADMIDEPFGIEDAITEDAEFDWLAKYAEDAEERAEALEYILRTLAIRTKRIYGKEIKAEIEIQYFGKVSDPFSFLSKKTELQLA